MVTTTTEQAGTPSQQTTQPQSIDDFRSLLAAVPPAKADALKERIYDWLEKRERDVGTALEKAKARAAIVEEQNRIVRMELQDVESDRLREEDAAATREARAGLFEEVMSALSAPDAPVPMEGAEEEESDNPGLLPTDYQQPTDSSVTAHPLQPLGTDIAKKVHAGDIAGLDSVIKVLLDEVVQLREGASANVARIITLEDQLQSANNALAVHLAAHSPPLDEAFTAQNYNQAWGAEPGNSHNTSHSLSFSTPATTQSFCGEEKEQVYTSHSLSFSAPATTQSFCGEDKEQVYTKGPDVWTRDTAPSPWSWSTRTLRDHEPAPIRGYLDDESDGHLHDFDACFKQYADMMLCLQPKANDRAIEYDEIPWPVLPDTPDQSYPVPRWRARGAEKEDVDKFVQGFLASKHAEVWRGSMRDNWLDLLEFKHDGTNKEIVERMVGHLN